MVNTGENNKLKVLVGLDEGIGHLHGGGRVYIVVKLADNTENGFCTACFGGGYPTSIPKDGGKDRFECKISEGEKKKNA